MGNMKTIIVFGEFIWGILYRDSCVHSLLSFPAASRIRGTGLAGFGVVANGLGFRIRDLGVRTLSPKP